MKFCERKFLFLLPLLLSLTLIICPVPADAAQAQRKFADIERFPQDGSSYLPSNPDAPIADYVNQVVYAEEYLRRHFAPWQADDLSFLDLTFERLFDWHKSLAAKQWYSSDGKQMTRSSIDAVAKNGVIDENAVPRPGVIILPTDVRVLPYERPVYDSQAAALGSNGRLRLDILQNSTAHLGEPLAAFGASADSNWIFIATGTVVGWVKASSVALVDYDFIDQFMFSEKVVVARDNIEITGEQGNLLYKLKLGTVLPIENDEVLLPARGRSGLADVIRLRLNSDIDHAFPMFPIKFTPRNAALAIEQLMGEPYGWGGAQGFRDCSAMTKDYFSLFGIWLPRNSGDQAVTGARISLRNIPVGERSGVIANQGVPFATLIQMPGHIMLYIGVYDGEPLVFHNTWGVQTRGGGRAVVGRAVVTSLRLGAEIPDKQDNSLLLDRIAVMSFPMADLVSAAH